MEANTHRVPPKQWKKWSEHARRVFNALHGLLRKNQKIFMHPDAAVIPDKHWATIAWNASWEAADAADAKPAKPGSLVQDWDGSKIVRTHVVQ